MRSDRGFPRPPWFRGTGGGKGSGGTGRNQDSAHMAHGKGRDQSRPPFLKKHLGGPYLPHGGLRTVMHLQEEGASAVPPGKSSHLSIKVGNPHCFRHLPKCSFLQLFWFSRHQTTEATLLKQLLRHSVQRPALMYLCLLWYLTTCCPHCRPQTYPFNLGSPHHPGQRFWLLYPAPNSSSCLLKCGYSSHSPIISNKAQSRVSGGCRTFDK